MGNIFNIKRFGLVIRKDIMEEWKRYTLMFLTMLGLIAIMLIFGYLDYYDDVKTTGNYQSSINNEVLVYLSLMFCGFGLIFASTFMHPMNSKLKKLTYLVSPSSNLEKFLTRWIIVTIVYIISFFIAMWVADALRVVICAARYPDLDVAFVDLTKLVSPYEDYYSRDYVFRKYIFIVLVNLYLLLQSLCILGSTFWEKSSFFKTFTAGALIFLAYLLICHWTILLFYDGYEEFGNVLNSLESIHLKKINENDVLKFISYVMSFFTLSFWTLAFFRFRESEIIKRF